MGSVPSTPNQEPTSDPWWLIENQTLELNPPAMNTDDENDVESLQGQQINADPVTVDLNQTENENILVDNIVKISESECEIMEENVEQHDFVLQPIESCSDSSDQIEQSKKSKSQQSLEEFKEELRIKREQRKSAISELRNEMSNLRRELAEEKALNKKLMNERRRCQCNAVDIEEHSSVDEIDSSKASLQSQLSESQYALQMANAEILSLTSELSVTKRQTQSLKDVIAASKQMLEIRESELNQLKLKLREIENSLAERETKLMSENLRQEYDRQLANIRHLKSLYEERARVSAAEKENLNRRLETSRAEYSTECEKNKTLSEHITSLEKDLKTTSDDLFATREQLTYYKMDNGNLHEEMTVINQLFSQLLAGFNGNNNIDIDQLTHMLEENRDLINDITSKESCKEGAAQIPKLLLDIITHKSDDAVTIDSAEPSTSTTGTEASASSKVTSPQEIVHNLPKVWRVLVELLNHQKLKPVQIQEDNQNEYCYKSVETPAGPKMVLSLSKTYIRLKDLILEKKFLQKETKKLKNLNSHLENRLGEQENRLGAVTIELNKTWNLVGRMQRQHRQLHTHEQVLRYQLQQKRRMLSELKEELEYCRRKWALAKEKNTESQSQWESLRMEFHLRKGQDSNNSAESGYSDGPASEEEEEDDSSVSTESSTYAKRKANKEKFLLKVNEHKATRMHSVSPSRSVKMSISRRNSDSHLTQFATEEFQIQSDMVQPMVQANCTENCGENCVRHSVHFDNRPTGIENSNTQIKVIETVVRKALPSKTQAQKLIEAKAAKSKTKMCCEMRKSTASTSRSNGDDESLEEMFLRLSGQEQSPKSNTSTEIDEDLDDDLPVKCCEEQCEMSPRQLLHVAEESNPKTEITDIKQNLSAADDRLTTVDNEPQPSTSSGLSFKKTNDEDCLTDVEKSYTQRRDERLKRMEAEFGAFVNKMKLRNQQMSIDDSQSSSKGEQISNDSEKDLPMQCSKIANDENDPQPSTSSGLAAAKKTDEDCLTSVEKSYTQRRDERLKRLEAEFGAFMNKVKLTSRRASMVENKLEYLHGRYNSESALNRQRNAPQASQSVDDELITSSQDEQADESQSNENNENHHADENTE